MKGLPHLRLSLSVVAILAVMLLAGGWSAPLDAAAAPGAYLRPVAPSAADSITLLAVADTTVKSGFPNANFGGADTLDLEYASDGRTIARVLLRFDLAAGLPSGAVIDSAQLQVLLNSGTGVSPITVRASTVTQGWAELGVTWDTAPSIGDPSADAQVGTTQGWVTWDVTAIAQGWQTGRNYGLELRGPESSADWYRTFRSRHPVEAEPRLVVTYSFQDTTPPSNPTQLHRRSHCQPVVQQRLDQRPLGRRVGRGRQRRLRLFDRVERIADDRAGLPWLTPRPTRTPGSLPRGAGISTCGRATSPATGTRTRPTSARTRST